jgi:hypothetical protein
MPTYTQDDFVIYNDELHTGITEVLEQRAIAMNAASQNTVRLVTQSLLGEFEKTTFFDVIDNLVQERDPTSVAAVTATSIEQSEHVSPKVNRRIGPNKNTLDKFKKIGATPALRSFILGQQSGKAVSLDYLNTGLTALATAITSEANLVIDVTAGTDDDKRISRVRLNRARALLGDAGNQIRAWVMPSAPYWSLVEDALTSNLTGLADVVVYGGLPGTLGMPVYMTDSPALIDLDPAGDDSEPAAYTILGLTEGALTLTQSEETDSASEIITGLANLVVQWQVEYAFNVKVKGFSFTTAAPSPTNAQLGNGANWTYVLTDIKSGPGVALIVDNEVPVEPTV